MDSMVYNQKLMDLLDDNNTYEQISLQTITNNISNFNKSYKKTNLQWRSILVLINQLPPKMYGLPKPIASGDRKFLHQSAQPPWGSVGCRSKMKNILG